MAHVEPAGAVDVEAADVDNGNVAEADAEAVQVASAAADVDNGNVAEADAEAVQVASAPNEHTGATDEAIDPDPDGAAVEPGFGEDGVAEVDLEAVDGPDTAAAAGAAGIAVVAVTEAGDQDDTVVMHTSGCERILRSLVCALCVAPAVIVAMCFLLGWNERRAVCDMRATVEGKDVVQITGCSNAVEGNGELIMFSCDLQRASLPFFSATGDFNSTVSFQGTGMRTDSEMFQCVEHARTGTRKNSIGGGKTNFTYYSYSREWSTSLVDSRNFRAWSQVWQQECGVENPAWPEGMPAAGSQYAESGEVGAYTVMRSHFLDRVPLESPLSLSGVPPGWDEAFLGSSLYYIKGSGKANNIGDVRVRFYGNDWSQTLMTVVGQNNDGVMERWMASDSWLCDAFQLGELRMGSFSKDALLESFLATSSALTWVLRFVVAIVMWVAFCLIFKPLEVATDFVPFDGPYIGNCISCVIPLVTCPLACACSIGVAGAVWVFMRPIVGGLLMVVCVAIFCAACILGISARNKKPYHTSAGPEAQAPEGVAEAQMHEGSQDVQGAQAAPGSPTGCN